MCLTVVKSACRYYRAAKLAEALSKEFHYTVDEKQKSVLMTEEGYEGAEEVLGVRPLGYINIIHIT